ncbi:hypothetical protein CKO31_16885 [Thiohalocapsa halophila]|uniref:Uncharacterized protein n=1 Tax=Thiohalocapsa halophila TaxID=69359 RepID=A0ABS1CKL9_9GAMM|nr:hypothetical protein [Thiohalocapsa halophila]MBK1632382.1 hypothetical protein [Thiohalocapsa halophila]
MNICLRTALSGAFAGALLALGPAVTSAGESALALSYAVQDNGEGFVDFTLEAQNISSAPAFGVVVQEASGQYPALFYGDIQPGEVVGQQVYLTYQGEPPRLAWSVSYTDDAGNYVSVLGD